MIEKKKKQKLESEYQEKVDLLDIFDASQETQGTIILENSELINAYEAHKKKLAQPVIQAPPKARLDSTLVALIKDDRIIRKDLETYLHHVRTAKLKPTQRTNPRKNIEYSSEREIILETW